MKLDLFSEPVKEVASIKGEQEVEDTSVKVIDATELAKESH